MKKIMLFTLSFFIVACSPVVQSVDYYLENIDIAKDVLKNCEVKQGSKQDQNCINAEKALYKKDMSKKFGGY